MQPNRIYHGDNMYFMPDMPSESIDLIYIDPPFGTQSLWKSKAFNEKVQDLQFYDIWGGGKDGYINFMVERLRHIHRLLKPTGSLFVHLDWRMSHYIKIELDEIFGVKNPASNNTNFVNEIIWHYETGGAGKRSLAKKHDTILFYSKTNRYNFFPDKIKDDRTEKSLLRARNPKGARYDVKDNKKLPMDVWQKIPALNPMSKERTGWPTQKPLDLLTRIIKMASKPDDLVADFFCGCGTSIVAAQKLKRKWIGMDASKTACEVMLQRIKEGDPLSNCKIISKPMTLEGFNKLDPLEFEKAAVRYIGGVTNKAQVADGGIDGRLAFDGTPIQVKKHNKPIGDINGFRAFYEPLKQHGRGIFITLEGYKRKAKEKAEAWRREGLDIQLLTIKDILAGKFREQPLRNKQESSFYKERQLKKEHEKEIKHIKEIQKKEEQKEK